MLNHSQFRDQAHSESPLHDELRLTLDGVISLWTLTSAPSGEAFRSGLEGQSAITIWATSPPDAAARRSRCIDQGMRSNGQY